MRRGGRNTARNRSWMKKEYKITEMDAFEKARVRTKANLKWN